MISSCKDKTTRQRNRPPTNIDLPDEPDEEIKLNKTLHMIERYLIKGFDCERCSTLLLMEDKIKIFSEMCFSEMPEETEFLCTSVDLKHLSTIRWNTPPEIIKEKLFPYLNPDGVGSDSSIASPLFIGDYLRGVVCLTRTNNRTFSEKEQALLNLFTSRLTLLILKILARSHSNIYHDQDKTTS